MLTIAMTYEEVLPFIEQLLAQGEKPTILRLRELAGQRLTVPVAARHLKKWRELTETEGLSAGPNAHTLTQPYLPNKADDASVKLAESSYLSPSLGDALVMETSNSGPRSARPRKKFLGRTVYPQKQPEDELVLPPSALEEVAVGQDNVELVPVSALEGENFPEMPKHLEDFVTHTVEPFAYDSIEHLALLTPEQLLIRVRRMQGFLLKERNRAEHAEKALYDAKMYAELIKSKVSHRVHEIRNRMQRDIDQLSLELKSCKLGVQEELLYYRQQFARANNKIVQLSAGALQEHPGNAKDGA